MGWLRQVVKHVQKAKVAAFKEVVAMEIKVFKQLTSHPGPFSSAWPAETVLQPPAAQGLFKAPEPPRPSLGWRVAMT